jgi:N-acetylglucosaminyldiphosphoundecaprenol N-acetyl-beta-D-mannosaminyltransferase
MRRPITIFGVTLTDQTQQEALSALDLALRGSHCQTVFFPNAATLNLVAERRSFGDTLNAANHVFGDGTGVRWAARMRGIEVQANLNGTDLIPAFVERHKGLRVFLLGGTPELIAATSDGFKRRFPDAELVGAHHGYFDHHESGDVIKEIEKMRPDLLLVGFGNPLQEEWLTRHRHNLPVNLAAGVGGLFSYWAGTLERAPTFYRKIGMEWVHILLSQPHKAKRYLIGNPQFLMRMIKHLPSDMARDEVVANSWSRV